jgi:hypothetical protein
MPLTPLRHCVCKVNLWPANSRAAHLIHQQCDCGGGCNLLAWRRVHVTNAVIKASMGILHVRCSFSNIHSYEWGITHSLWYFCCTVLVMAISHIHTVAVSWPLELHGAEAPSVGYYRFVRSAQSGDKSPSKTSHPWATSPRLRLAVSRQVGAQHQLHNLAIGSRIPPQA